jgi:hypothetical protein
MEESTALQSHVKGLKGLNATPALSQRSDRFSRYVTKIS